MRAPLSRLLATLLLLGAAAPPEPARADICVPERFEGADYIVCTVDPADDRLRIFWRGTDGRPYRSFSNLARGLADRGDTLVFAINGGMYEPDYTPLGLYVEDGRELRPADQTRIDKPQRQVPNFYKAPNGVFYVSAEGDAAILTTPAFLARRPATRMATQSGPMLVIDGALHPALIPGSSDRTRRSGVGVCASGRVRFAISQDSVNFHSFARLFQDHLACPNALFLDGGRGAGLYAPSLDRNDWSWHGGYGPMIGLVE